jgi:hypothetical protein
VSLVGAKRKPEESDEEAESTEAAKRQTRANEWPAAHGRLGDQAAAGEKVEGAVRNMAPIWL